MPSRSTPYHAPAAPAGTSYLDRTGRVWRVGVDGVVAPTEQVVYAPSNAPSSAFQPPPPEPAPEAPDLLQRATNFVEDHVPGGWWLVAGVGGALAWMALVPPAKSVETKTEDAAEGGGRTTT